MGSQTSVHGQQSPQPPVNRQQMREISRGSTTCRDESLDSLERKYRATSIWSKSSTAPGSGSSDLDSVEARLQRMERTLGDAGEQVCAVEYKLEDPQYMIPKDMQDQSGLPTAPGSGSSDLDATAASLQRAFDDAGKQVCEAKNDPRYRERTGTVHEDVPVHCTN